MPSFSNPFDGYVQYQWDDFLVPMTRARINAATSKPDYDTFKNNVKAHLFDKASTETVTFDVQLPHSWVEGTEIRPHVHWCPVDTDTGSVLWRLEYTIASVNGTFGATTTIDVLDAADGTAYKHQVAAFPAITMTGHTVSCMLVCALSRIGGDGTDTYDNDAAGLAIDFHIAKNSYGSSQEYTK